MVSLTLAEIRTLARNTPGLRAIYHALKVTRDWLYHVLIQTKYLAQRCYYAVNRSATPPPGYYLQFVRTTLPVGRPTLVVGSDVGIQTNPDGSRDFSHYNVENFLDIPRYENYDFLHGRVRKEDMGSAALYAHGIESFQEAQWILPETTFEAQVQSVLRAARRHPRYVADVGCGLGSLAALFVAAGARVDAIDPSPVAGDRVLDTVSRFNKRPSEELKSKFRLLNVTLGEYLKSLANTGDFPDTFVFVESVEHIPSEEMLSAIEVFRSHGNCILIITSAVDFHPILPDGTGWNHITLVDDAYYAKLASMARRKILQVGSHLVLEF